MTLTTPRGNCDFPDDNMVTLVGLAKISVTVVPTEYLPLVSICSFSVQELTGLLKDLFWGEGTRDCCVGPGTEDFKEYFPCTHGSK